MQLRDEMEPGHVGSFASVLRQLRTQAGLSLRGLGKLALYDYSRLSRAERGEILPPEPQVQMLDKVLHANGLLISLWRTAPEVPAASTATASALRIAHEWLVSEPPQLLRLRAGRRIGAAQAAQIQDRVIQLRHLDDHLSGRDLAPVVLREYKATATIIDQSSYRETTGRLLLSSLAELAQITGWVLSDAGLHRQAQDHYLEGVQAAQQAGATDVAANLLSCLAYQWTGRGLHHDAVLLAATAAQGARRSAVPVVRALLGERLAYARAYAGDPNGTARALDDVDDTYEARSPGDDDPEWTYWLSRDEITVMAARCWTRLGQPGKAAPLIAAALTRYGPGQTREQALYWSFLAEAYLQAGQRAEAAQALSTAGRYAARTSSARVDQRIALLRHALQLSLHQMRACRSRTPGAGTRRSRMLSCRQVRRSALPAHLSRLDGRPPI
jgi:transcriptional regulator with XRE-family HTH domain